VKGLIFSSYTGQHPTYYTLGPVFWELTLENKQTLVLSSHRLSFLRLFTQPGETLGRHRFLVLLDEGAEIVG